MYLILSPARRDDLLTVERDGETLIVNGRRCDLSGIAEGASATPAELGCAWLSGDVSRREGRLYVPLVLPHAARAPRETLYPEPLEVTRDGPVNLPPHALVESAQEGGEPDA